MLESIINAKRNELGIPNTVDTSAYQNLYAAFEHAVARFGDKPAFTSLGRTLTFSELKARADQFAAYIQHHTDLQPGDKIALQLPNLIQYPVVMFGAFKAGLVVVNTNPLYSARELEHQFNDSEAKALVVSAVVAANVQEVLPKTGIKHVIVTSLADLHTPLKRVVVNAAAKYIKKMIPDYHIPGAVSLVKALKLGSAHASQAVGVTQKDLAVLQYTGGTTGLPKGAMLTHGNLLANTLQAVPIFKTYGFNIASELLVQPLPLYHIYAFTVSMILLMTGNQTVLIPNPRDIPGLVKELKKWRYSGFCGLNTLFVALSNNEEFKQSDFSALKMTLSGGMALTKPAEATWHDITGVHIFEGYGLTETSPVVSVNPGNGIRVGSIGLPVASTEVRLVDDDGKDVGVGEAGELCVRGPQVMKGYWQKPEETAKVIDSKGWFYTGDVAQISDDGYLSIVDRKKDMILVSGFNVYPNELEDVLCAHPGVVECAAVGVPDERSGEAVKMFVVADSVSLGSDEVIAYCRKNLAAYKVPKYVEFRDDLPKSNVGKILRRELRDS
jgi:long-chain acyl-CoA synthetase